MLEADEVVVVENNNKRLPNLKKIIIPQCEKIRYRLVEVVTGTVAPCVCSAVEDKPENPWYKRHNGLWDPLI